MKRIIVPGILTLSAAMALAIIWPSGNCAWGSAASRPAADQHSTSRPVVVVELFTSEGCSSCPPADQLLQQLANQSPVPGVELITLSEHVDYWNHLGWSDPYSSAALTARQREYADSLRLEVYTPQMVVDGKVGFVGAEGVEAVKAISDESKIAKATVRIEPVKSSKEGQQAFSISVENLPQLDGRKKAEVVLAITENNLRSTVAAGENSGRTLTHTGVVRELKTIGTIGPKAGASFSAQPFVAVSKGWKRNDLRAIVLVQVQGTQRILGAGETTFSAL